MFSEARSTRLAGAFGVGRNMANLRRPTVQAREHSTIGPEIVRGLVAGLGVSRSARKET